MTDRDDVDRYERLLSDWKPAAPRKRSGTPSLTTAHNDSITPMSEEFHEPAQQPAQQGPLFHAPGRILCLGGRTLVIFKQAVPEKGYDLVYTLLPGGSVKLQGVALNGHAVQEIGSIGQPYFDQFQNSMHWNRDLIVFHCYRFEDVAITRRARGHDGAGARAPAGARLGGQPQLRPDAPAAAGLSAGSAARSRGPAQVAQTRPAHPTPVRPEGLGRRLLGPGRPGQVVAHQTYNTWSLMHLDLDRFADPNMIIDPNVDEAIIRVIEQNLNGAQS